MHDCLIATPIDDDIRTVTATFHVDHLLLDNTPESQLRFQLIADADGNGGPRDSTITLPELAATAINDHPLYRVASTRDFAGQPIVNLRQYLKRRVGSFGHVDGENPCQIVGTP